MKWNIEWIDLQNIEHMIAECWRMNDSQLTRYFHHLARNRDLVFAGGLGAAFLEMLRKGTGKGSSGAIDWPKLQKDVRFIRDLIKEGQEQDESYWKSQYKKLASNPSAYFYTDMGHAFLERLSIKLEIDLNEQQKQLCHDLRKIQKICEACNWGNEAEVQKALSFLEQKGKNYFSSWLGDGFLHLFKQQYGPREDPKPELSELYIHPEPKIADRKTGKRSRKAKIAWILAALISISFLGWWAYGQMQGEGDKFPFQNIVSAILKTQGAETGKTQQEKQRQMQDDADMQSGNGSAGNIANVQPAGTVENTNGIQSGNAGENTADIQSGNAGENTGDMQSGNAGDNSLDNDSGSNNNQKGNKTDSTPLSSQNALDPNTADTGTGSNKKAAVPDILPQYRTFHKQYPDLFGWLKIPGTEIDHPVMQSKKEEKGGEYYYLHRDYTGKETEQGSLFVEKRSCCFPQDDNTVIYGHNMSNGHNFGILENYMDPDFFQTHQTIQYDTIYEEGSYQVAAVLLARVLYQEETGFRYYRLFNYDTKREFQECTDFIKDNQMYDTGVDLQYGDQLLMLSTCEYSRENGRLVIVAKKKE